MACSCPASARWLCRRASTKGRALASECGGIYLYRAAVAAAATVNAILMKSMLGSQNRNISACICLEACGKGGVLARTGSLPNRRTNFCEGTPCKASAALELVFWETSFSTRAVRQVPSVLRRWGNLLFRSKEIVHPGSHGKRGHLGSRLGCVALFR